jgi:hydrogenase large subunit
VRRNGVEDEALPGYEQVGLRRTLLGCWGSFQDPEVCNFAYNDITDWGRAMFVTPGVVVDGKLVTTDLVTINLGIRILLGSSYYDDWTDQEMFVTRDPLGNPVDRRHPCKALAEIRAGPGTGPDCPQWPCPAGCCRTSCC